MLCSHFIDTFKAAAMCFFLEYNADLASGRTDFIVTLITVAVRILYFIFFNEGLGSS